METGRRYNKTITANHGTGLSDSGSPSVKTVFPVQMREMTAGFASYGLETDSKKTLTGAGEGDIVAGNSPTVQRWGYNAPSGSRIEVNDGPGSERIDIVHTSGAAVTIDPDGSVFVTSTSQRGAGIGAPFGDVFISAGGDLVINGAGSVSIKTAGDLTLDIGGTLNIKCAAYNLQTKTQDETVDGAASRSVTNDQSVVIGGISRVAVAGDAREQISGSYIQDVAGTSTARIDGNNSVDVGGTSTQTIKGDHKLQSSGKTSIVSSSDTTIDSGSNMISKAGGTSELHAGGDIAVTSGGNLVASGDSAYLASSGTTSVSSEGTVNLYGNIAKLGAGSMFVDGDAVQITGGTTNVDGGEINLNGVVNATIAGAGGGPGSPDIQSQTSTPSPQGPTGPQGAKEAETMEANDIVDELTSQRKYPKYVGNGRRESADLTSYGMISHDQQPQAEDVYNEYSGGNQGSLNSSQPGGSYDTLPEQPVDRNPNIEVVDPGISNPSQYNYASKISKYFTLGQLVNAPASETIPQDKWESVVKNHILLANNVLDPIKEKFPDIIITNCYRSDSPNHITGKACDIVASSRSMTRHAEIARYARDNLPIDQVFLEKNDTGKSHVHLRVGSGKPSVITCGDKKCINKTSGIDVEYLVNRRTI